MKEKVSIIVPVYNVEKYLQRCVDSLLGQTYTELEIILVDDGSSDHSGELCDTYATKDNRVKVIHQKNAGQSAARNQGLKTATGSYICYVDSDDYVSKQYIETLYALLTEHKADIAMCSFDYFKGDSYEESKESKHNHEIITFSNFEMIKNMHVVQGELFVVVWGKLYKRKVIEDIFFPQGRICEDLAVLYQYYDRADVTVKNNDILYYYNRSNENSSTFNINQKFYDDVFWVLSNEENYLEEKKYHEQKQYAMKTHMYWLFDYYTKIHKTDKVKAKELFREYKRLYKMTADIKREKFYTFFYFAPKIYLFLKRK